MCKRSRDGVKGIILQSKSVLGYGVESQIFADQLCFHGTLTHLHGEEVALVGHRRIPCVKQAAMSSSVAHDPALYTISIYGVLKTNRAFAYFEMECPQFYNTRIN